MSQASVLESARSFASGQNEEMIGPHLERLNRSLSWPLRLRLGMLGESSARRHLGADARKMRLQLPALIEGLAHLGHAPKEHRDALTQRAGGESALIERLLHAEQPRFAFLDANIEGGMKGGNIG